LWVREADKENRFWADAAKVSREYLKKAAHSKTWLTPEYAGFDGMPTDPPWGGGHDAFRFDAWRVAMNVAMDHVWFQKDPWAVTQSNRLLDFFTTEGLDSYVNQYTLDGQCLSQERSSGLMAMNAVACLAATHENREAFVQALWDQSIPAGQYRYYDGLLYMLAMLQLSGQFQIYYPAQR